MALLFSSAWAYKVVQQLWREPDQPVWLLLGPGLFLLATLVLYQVAPLCLSASPSISQRAAAAAAATPLLGLLVKLLSFLITTACPGTA